MVLGRQPAGGGDFRSAEPPWRWRRVERRERVKREEEEKKNRGKVGPKVRELRYYILEIGIEY